MASISAFRALSLLIGTVALVWALLPAAIAAASRPMTFAVEIGDQCLQGTASDGATVRVVWKSPNGQVKLKTRSVADRHEGTWRVCGDQELAVGDIVKSTVGTKTHKLVIPSLNVDFERVTNIFSGEAPAGGTVRLTRPVEADVQVDESGHWSYHDPNRGFRTAFLMTMAWLNGAGDWVGLTRFAPAIELTLGASTYHAFGKTGRTITLTLSRPATATSPARIAMSTVTVATYWGEFSGVFRDADGRRMRVRPGDHISAPGIGSDADFMVPRINGRADAVTDIVKGRCFDGGTSSRWYHVGVVGPLGGGASGLANPDGTFSIDFNDPASGTGVYHSQAADVESGNRINVWCQQESGDQVIGQFRVP